MLEFITSIALTNIDLFSLIYTLVTTPQSVGTSIGMNPLPECPLPSFDVTCGGERYWCNGNQQVYMLCTSQLATNSTMIALTIISVILSLPLLIMTIYPWK